MTDTELDRLLDTWQTPEPSPSMRQRALPPVQGLRRWPWATAAACLALAAVFGFMTLNDLPVAQFVGSPAPGLHARVTVFVEPSAQTLYWSWRTGAAGSMGNGRLGRLVYDRVSKTYSSYELNFTPIGPGLWSMTADASEQTFAKAAPRLDLSGYRHIPARLPQAGRVAAGDTVEVELLAGLGPSDRFRETVEFSATPLSLAAPPDSPAREHAEMRVAEPRVEIAGRIVHQDGGIYTGQTIQLDSSVEGTYVLAIDPKGNPNFVEAGFAEGALVEFRAGSRWFRIVSSAPVAAGGRRTVYLLHRPAQGRAAGLPEQFSVSSSGPASLF